MLEKIGTPGYENISRPAQDVVNLVKEIKSQHPPIVAEIGIGVGATTLAIAEALENSGHLYIFDFEKSVSEIKSDLAARGFENVTSFGNTTRHWDSYHWNIAELIKNEDIEFDLIFLDGAHTYLHDALAFFQCDRLLRLGGYIVFDDYGWSYSTSAHMKNKRLEYMTEEQVDSKQIAFFIDTLVRNHVGYEEVWPNRIFRKIAVTHRSLKD